MQLDVATRAGAPGDGTARAAPEDQALEQAINEREQIAAALSESEQRYRDLIEHGQGLICTHSLDGTLLSVNKTAAQRLGYAPEELAGRNLRDFLAPDSQQHFDTYLTQGCV